MKDKSLNKTICKFTYRGKRFEVDQLLDTKWGGKAGTPRFYFDIFVVTKKDKVGECVGQFEGYVGADYKKLAIYIIETIGDK